MKDLFNQIRTIDHENTKQFLTAFISHSIINRLPLMALKLSIYDNLEHFIKVDNINKIQKSQIIDLMYIHFEQLINDIKISINNIITHQETNLIKNNSNQLILNKIKTLNYTNQLLLFKISYQYNLNKNNLIKYDDIINKGKLKYLKKNIIKRGVPTNTKILNNFSLNIVLKNQNLEFRVFKDIEKYYKIMIEDKNFINQLNKFDETITEQLSLNTSNNNNNNNNIETIDFSDDLF